MKVVITVTSVYDFPDDVVIEEVTDGEESLGQHIVVNGCRLQPIVDFLGYEGAKDGSPSWDVPDEEVTDQVYDCLEAEEYSIIPVDGFQNNE